MTPDPHEPSRVPDDLPINPIAGVRPRTQIVPDSARLGPPPADFATRPPSGVPTPEGDGLNATEVAALVGQGEATDVNAALEHAGGLDGTTES